MDKKVLRRLIMAEISAISLQFLNESSATISDIVASLDAVKNAQNVFIYQSFGREIKTSAIISWLLNEGKTVGVPKLVNGRMLCVKYSEEQCVNEFGIKEPIETEEIDCDVALIPAVAFDECFNRLGRGKGYYDSFLHRHKGIVKIGIAFSFQVLQSIPHDEKDVKMDIIVTEEGAIHSNYIKK